MYFLSSSFDTSALVLGTKFEDRLHPDNLAFPDSRFRHDDFVGMTLRGCYKYVTLAGHDIAYVTINDAIARVFHIRQI